MGHYNNYEGYRFREKLVLVILGICFLLFYSHFANSQLTSDISSSGKNVATHYSGSLFSSPPPKYTALNIGEDMPDIEFRMMNYSSTKARVSDFRGKLLLLDFWATWCSACINQFSKLDSLQKIYKDEVQIILINSKSTRDSEARIKEFLEKRKQSGHGLQIAIAVLDVDADLLFPHIEIPHYAWIGPDGRFKAVTGSYEVTGQNIRSIFASKQTRMVQKKDFSSETLMDLGQGDFPINDNLVHYSIFKKGKIEGVSVIDQPRWIEQNGVTYVRGKAMRNLSLIEMYMGAIYMNQKFRDYYSEKRLLVEAKNRSNLIFDASISSKEAWEKDNLYTYDLIIPANEQDKIYTYIIDDLNRYSDFYGRIEARKIKILALIRTSSTDKIRTKGGAAEFKIYKEEKEKYITNLPISQFVWRLDRLNFTNLPIIDETSYKTNIDLTLNVNLDDLGAIRNELKKYDLDLVEKERLVEVFVISDKRK